MRLINTCKPARRYILYFALVLFSLQQAWFFSDVFPHSVVVDKVLRLIYVLAIAMVFLLQDYSPKMFLTYGLLAAACVLTRLGSGLIAWTYTVMAILALRQEDLTEAPHSVTQPQFSLNKNWGCVTE